MTTQTELYSNYGEQTINQVCDSICERVQNIEKEFKAGFEFIKKAQHSVTIFGSARTPEDDPDYISARELGSRIVKELDYAVLTLSLIHI